MIESYLHLLAHFRVNGVGVLRGVAYAMMMPYFFILLQNAMWFQQLQTATQIVYLLLLFGSAVSTLHGKRSVLELECVH
jgi:hypothetical protein